VEGMWRECGGNEEGMRREWCEQPM